MKTWRDKVDASIKDHLEVQIAEATKHKGAYKKSKDPANAQLWCAIANLSKQIFEINLRMKYLENVVKETLPKTRKETREERDMIRKIAAGERITKKGKALKKALRRY